MRRISTAIFTGVVSVVPTRRRRFLWAAWWTAPPEADPFRRPDASSGGARTPREALDAACAAAGRGLVEIDGRWAGAWVRVQRGEAPFPKPKARAAAPEGEAARATGVSKGSRAWALGVLGLPKDATADAIKRAFRALALRTHPDRGGDSAAFLEAMRAQEVALGGRGRKAGGK
jgi:hypothetical protein